MYKELEESIVKKICDYLKTVPNCWFFKVKGGAHQKKGVPDIIGCYKGSFFAFEVKRPGGKTTELQQFHIERIQNAGGAAYMVDSVTMVQCYFKMVSK